MNNKELINKFYTSFANRDINGMIACYHDEIQFEDPAFGKLYGEDVKLMWKMLLSSSNDIHVKFNIIETNEKEGLANWEANYIFSQTGRTIVNKISAQFIFEEGKIIKHTDFFNLWKWSQQAFGWKGYLLGWTSFFRSRMNKTTRNLLNKYKNS